MSQWEEFKEVCQCGHLKIDHNPDYPHNCIAQLKLSYKERMSMKLFQVCTCDEYKK